MKILSRILQNSPKIFRILVLKSIIDVCKAHTVCQTTLKSMQAGVQNNSHLIKNLPRLPTKNTRYFMRLSNAGSSCSTLSQNGHFNHSILNSKHGR